MVILLISLLQYLILAISRKAKEASLKFVYFAFQIPFFQTVKHPESSAEETVTKGLRMVQGGSPKWDRAVPTPGPGGRKGQGTEVLGMVGRV